MKSLAKRSVSALLILCVSLGLWTPTLSAAASSERGAAALAAEERSLSYRPLELDVPSVTDYAPRRYRAASVPAAYDLGATVPAPRDQNPFGTCWTFGTLAAAETNLLMRGLASPGSLDLSEMHMAYFTYHKPVDPLGGTAGDTINVGNDYMNVGGNSEIATMMLAGWLGAAPESAAVYPSAASGQEGYAKLAAVEKTLSADTAYDHNAYILRDAYWVSMEDTAEIKRLIMTKGAASVGYYHEDACLNENTFAYLSAQTTANHQVSIVGWDDNYSRANFGGADGGDALPRRDGAWLIRNSWGEGWGLDGYFWLSYEEPSLDSQAILFDLDEAGRYDYNYQYDGGAAIQYFELDSGSSMANAFTARGSEYLAAASFYTYEPNVTYTVDVYTGLASAADPTSGTRVAGARVSGSAQYAGYHTVDLGQPIPLERGQRFSVVVTLTHASGTVSVPIDGSADYGWIRFACSAEAGQSFFREQGAWIDVSARYEANMRIKALTVGEREAEFAVAPVAEQTYTGKAIEPKPVVTFAGATLVEGQDYRLAYAENVDAGKGYVYVWGQGRFSGVKTLAFTIKPKSLAGAAINPIRAKTFTGAAIAPTPTVRDGDAQLVLGRDYGITYTENVNVGTAKLTFTGRGNYTGSRTTTFTINPRSVSSLAVAPIRPKTYTGSAIMPTPSVRYGSKTFKLGTDYTFSYANNVNKGTARITVKGRGNLTGSKTVTFTINPRSVSSLTVAPIRDKAYTGKAFKPAPSVKYGGKTLTLGTHYTYSYRNNVKPGKAAITLTGRGNFTGSRTITFRIKPRAATLSRVSSTRARTLTAVWQRDTLATGYELSYSTDKSFAKGVVRKVFTANGNTSYTPSGLKSGKVYYVRVRAYKAIDGKRVYGGYSRVRSVRIR